MKKLALVFALSLVALVSFSQTWVFEKAENKFDGFSMELAGVYGTGEFPYNRPEFGVRTSDEYGTEFLLGSVGYQYGSTVRMYVDNGEVYEFSFDTDEANTLVFIYLGDKKDEIISLLKNGSRLYIRIYSRSGAGEDFTFPLRGSTAAINKLGL
mgnify:CR=1 FL=1